MVVLRKGKTMNKNKVYLLVDDKGNFLTTTKVESEAFRFENEKTVKQIADILGLDIRESYEKQEIKATAEVVNKW